MAASTAAATKSRLSTAAKCDLIGKLVAFVDRPRGKDILIFTDNVQLWQHKPYIAFCEEATVPVPEGYSSEQFNMMAEVGDFIALLTDAFGELIFLQLHNSGDDNSPRIHLIFGRRALASAEYYLSRTTSTCE